MEENSEIENCCLSVSKRNYKPRLRHTIFKIKWQIAKYLLTVYIHTPLAAWTCATVVLYRPRRLTKKKMFFHWILILLLNAIIAVEWPVVFNTILIQFVFNLKISQKVHSDDCRLDSGVKWWGHSSSIVTYRRKNSVCLRLNSFINLFLFLKDCELARHLECRKRMMFTEPNFGFNSVFFAKKQGFINTQNVN